jgi:effector-binding domain-containing protein
VIRAIVLTVLIAIPAFFAGGLVLPAVVEVERSIEIRRPVATVFELVNGFTTFATWSPWMARDPDMAFTISQPAAGPGARLEWRGDPRQVGAGYQEVVRSLPYREVDIRVETDQLGVAQTHFVVERIAGGARLSWRYRSDVTEGQGLVGGILSRYFGVFYDRWVSRDLERGLLRLKALAESLPAADFAGLQVERVAAPAFDIVYLTASAGSAGGAAPPRDLAQAYRELTAFIAEQDLELAGQPLAITHSHGGRWRVEAALPVTSANGLTPDPPIGAGRSPSGPAVRVVYRGPYTGITLLYPKIASWMAVRGLRGRGVSWERYVSDPAVTPPDERVTQIYVLLAE